jgi:D-alanyl-D-alanine carboxypeptidase
MKAVLIAVWCVVGGIGSARACDETVMIDSVEYKVIDQWCGLRVDTALLASPSSLVVVPSAFCYNGYSIYLARPARNAFVRMAEAAERDSIFLKIKSGYRSAGYQSRILKKRLDKGQSWAEVTKYVAPPGYSEHETGLAVDLAGGGGVKFGDSRAYQWLQEHAAEYGFRETYPHDPGSPLPWEPWHWAYFPENTDSTHSGTVAVPRSGQ